MAPAIGSSGGNGDCCRLWLPPRDFAAKSQLLFVLRSKLTSVPAAPWALVLGATAAVPGVSAVAASSAVPSARGPRRTRMVLTVFTVSQALREPLLFAGCSGADALRKTRAQQRPGSGNLPYTNCCARSLSVTSLLPPVSRAHRDDDFLNAYLDCATSGEFEAAHTL